MSYATKIQYCEPADVPHSPGHKEHGGGSAGEQNSVVLREGAFLFMDSLVHLDFIGMCFILNSQRGKRDADKQRKNIDLRYLRFKFCN